jgi:hypothetical protein
VYGALSYFCIEQASESDPEFDDDFEDFDPFEFIKNLPSPDVNSPRPSGNRFMYVLYVS